MFGIFGLLLCYTIVGILCLVCHQHFENIVLLYKYICLHNQEMVLISVELVLSFFNIVWASIMRMSPLFYTNKGTVGSDFVFVLGA